MGKIVNLLIRDFSSSTSVGRLLAGFVGPGKNSFCLGRFAAAWKAAARLAAIDETQWLSRGLATSTCGKKELELAPKTGFILRALKWN